MKYTLLDLTQTILSSMDSDEINSINDTVESQQVVKVIRTAYFDIINRANVPEQYSLFSLESSGDVTKPVLMTLPSDFKNISWLKYDHVSVTDTDTNMVTILPLPLEDFVERMYQLRESADNVGSFTKTIGTSTVTFLYTIDSAPRYYTTYNDGTIIFDSYDSEVDSTLQKSKTLAFGLKAIPWTNSDTFVPDLDDAQFALLLNEAKALAFNELKQTQHTSAERNSRRGWNQLQKQKVKISLSTDFDSLPDFGKRR